jgi:hypothetical protein
MYRQQIMLSRSWRRCGLIPAILLLSSDCHSAFGANVSTGVSMMTDQMPFSPKLACLPIALVAFSMAFGAPSVRAQSEANAPPWREIAVDPIMNAVHSIEQRLASIEATVASFAGSFTTQQLSTRQLCISDETGAQTCITKAQLDALLAKMAHAAAAEPPASVIEAPAEITEAPAIVTETYVSPISEPKSIDGDAKDSAALDRDADPTAVATALPIEGSGSKEEFSAQFEPTPSERGNSRGRSRACCERRGKHRSGARHHRVGNIRAVT